MWDLVFSFSIFYEYVTKDMVKDWSGNCKNQWQLLPFLDGLFNMLSLFLQVVIIVALDTKSRRRETICGLVLLLNMRKFVVVRVRVSGIKWD